MALSYLLAPIPKWVIMNNQGEAAGGAKLYTYRSRNKVQQKPVYQDPAGTIPWTNPILFDANGTEGPFYWQVDSADLGETYYLEAYDSDDNLLWTIDDYFPPGSGGGGNTTTYVPIRNYIANNVFIDHIDDTVNPIGVTNLLVAPSNHKGFTPDLINPVVGTFGVVGPDIRLVKNNTNATDQITFVDFSLSDGPLTADVTPVQYLRYQCTNSPAGETFKSFQFPICQKVKNLAGKEMTFQVWAKCASGTEDIILYTRQYFGSGGTPSAEVRTSQGTMNLDTNWTKKTIQFTVPSTAGKTVGIAGQQTDDDALYLHLEMPLGQPCDIWFTKPRLFLGTIDPDADFENYDQIDSVDQTPRTATIMSSLRTSAPRGWLPLNNGTIGGPTSGASTRANKDTFQLYKTLWDGVSNQFAPVSTGRGASAVADFSSGKTLTLTRAIGRVLADINPDMTSTFTVSSIDYGTATFTVASNTQITTGTPIYILSTAGMPGLLTAGEVYYAIRMTATEVRVARSLELAFAGTNIVFTNPGGVGTLTIYPALGAFTGEGVHTISANELPAHTHPISTFHGSSDISNRVSAVDVDTAFGTANTGNNTTTASPMNVVQPTAFVNFFIKM